MARPSCGPRTVARHCQDGIAFADTVLQQSEGSFTWQPATHRSRAPMHKVQGNPYLSGKEERLDSQFYGESDADTSSGPEDQAVETSGGSDSETTAGPNVASVLAEAPFLLMPLGTREDANTLAADSKTWPTVPCARPDMAPYPIRPTSAADQAAAFGVASQHLAEHADVAIRHPFPEFDTPVQSAAVDESAEP